MFKSKGNQFKLLLMKKEYGEYINEHTITAFNFKTAKKVMADESVEEAEHYLHYVFSKWFKNQVVNENLYRKTRSLIKSLKLQLTDIEKHNLLLVDEQVFSIDRHIKVLEVDIDLVAKEQVGVKFENAKLFRLIADDEELYNGSYELFLSNKRIILKSEFEVKDFFWWDLTFEDYLDKGYAFNHDGKEYLLRIHDQITLNETIQNFKRKRLKR